MRLADKAIIVTGSTTGIGEAIARRCVAEGARVLIHGRDENRGNALCAELGEAAAFHADNLGDADAPARLARAAIQAFGRIDGVVNNAAMILRSDLESTDANLFDRCLAINVRAPLLLIKAALPELKKSEGSIVNMGSVNAYTGEPRQLAYSISKGALMTMSRNLANSLASHRVRVTHFNTGWVLSENEYRLKISEGLPNDWPETIGREHVPSGRMTQPADIAAHTVFWLSDESRPITGSVIELEQHPVIGRIPLKEGDA